MADIDTEAERRWLADPCLDTDSMYAVAGKCGEYLDRIDRLRAENQRLEEQHEAMADALVTEGVKLHYAKNEIESVLQLMDGLAEQWGDEAVFRRCRDRLRALTKEAGE